MKTKKDIDHTTGGLSLTQKNCIVNNSIYLKQLLHTLPQKHLNVSSMGRLYSVLVHLSENEPVLAHSLDFFSKDTKVIRRGTQLKTADILDMCDILFAELRKRFQEIFSDSRGVPFMFDEEFSAFHEEVCVLLRCCLVIITLIRFDQQHILENGRTLLSILRKLICLELISQGDNNSLTLKKSFSYHYTSADADWCAIISEEHVAYFCQSQTRIPCSFLSAMLEVFIDELLQNKLLRDSFTLIDSSPSTSNTVSAFPTGHSNIGIVLDLVSTHFLLSPCNISSGNLIPGLSSDYETCSRTPQISLQAASSLICHPIILSSPKMLQAHLVLLVSAAIGVCREEMDDINVELLNTYSIAFERSVALYLEHISHMFTMIHPMWSSDAVREMHLLPDCSLLPFESFIRPETAEKMNNLVSQKDFSRSFTKNAFLETNQSNITGASVAFVKENLCFFNKRHREQMLSIMGHVVLKASSDDGMSSFKIDRGSIPDTTHLLASILSLMNCSMLKMLSNLRRIKSSNRYRSLADSPDYQSMTNLIRCFRKLCLSVPVQMFLSGVMQKERKLHTDSKFLFLHVASLLSLCYLNKLECLINPCLFALMTHLELFTVEEGDLRVLESLCDMKAGDSLFGDEFKEVLVVEDSSVVHMQHPKACEVPFRAETKVSYPNEHGRKAGMGTCNGKAFLECILGDYPEREEDIADLADFIVCKEGKDYSKWLKIRQVQRRRQLKIERTQKRYGKKINNVWGYLSGSPLIR